MWAGLHVWNGDVLIVSLGRLDKRLLVLDFGRGQECYKSSLGRSLKCCLQTVPVMRLKQNPLSRWEESAGVVTTSRALLETPANSFMCSKIPDAPLQDRINWAY